MHVIGPVPLAFAFKGERPYINISTMFAGILSKLARAAPGDKSPALVVDSMKAGQELAGHGLLTLALGARALPAVDDAVLTLIGTLDDVPFAAVLAADNDAGPAPREPGGREKTTVRNLVAAGPFAGRAELAALAEPADLVLAFVEANKQLHELTLKPEREAPKIRFGYLQHYETPLEADLRGVTVPVEFEHVGTRESGGRVHTLNRVTLHRPDRTVRFTLGFNFYW